MKNITLSMEESVIEMARSYAQQHHTTLNQMIRDLLKQKVTRPNHKQGIDELFELADSNPSTLENYHFCRKDIYDV